MDKHVKRLLEMSNYNPKKGKLNENGLSELAPSPTTPNVNTQQSTQQPPAQQNPQAIDAAFEKTLDDALNQLMQELPQDLQSIATTQGDKDGQLEPLGQQGQPTQSTAAPQQAGAPATAPNPQQVAEGELNEAIGALIAGGALALPAIGNLVGKAISFMGRKADSATIQAMGKRVTNAAEHLHHKYEGIIDKILSPLTKNASPQTRKLINKGVFYALVAALGGAGAFGAAHAAQGGNIGLAAVEGGLTSVKASELVAAVKEIIPKILAQVVA